MAHTPPAWIPWHPLAWLGDLSLQKCDNYAKGLWMQMLMAMHQSEVPGVLWSDGEAWTDERVARTIGGGSVEQNLEALKCLRENGVARKYPEGHRNAHAYYSKRLIKEIKERAAEMRKNAKKMRGWRESRKGGDVTVTLPSRNGNEPVRYGKNRRRGDKKRMTTTATGGVVAAVAEISLDPQTVNARIALLTKRPDWLPDDLPWITRDGARRIALAAGDNDNPRLTMTDIEDVIRDARRSRKTLSNPSGYVIDTLLQIATQKGTHASQPDHQAKSA